MSKNLQGTIKAWQDKKGFGFIALEGSDDVFLHISDIPNKQKPEVGEAVEFDLGDGRNGKVKAINVRLESQTSEGVTQKAVEKVTKTWMHIRLWQWMLIALPVLFSLFMLDDSVLPLVFTFVMSIAAFVALAVDKAKAQAGAWRVPESVLHLLELLGGWPGSLAGQELFRHKISKVSYQIVFWLIVVFHAYLWFDGFFIGGIEELL